MENSTMRKEPEQWFLDAHPERGSVRVLVISSARASMVFCGMLKAR